MEHEPKQTFIDRDQLQDIRRQTDWQKLFLGLGLERNAQRSTDTDWWTYSPFKQEHRPSFHLNEKGLWYDFSIRQGGGVIELVQKIYRVNCYEAAQIILDNRWLKPTLKNTQPTASKPRINPPIRQDLRPQLAKSSYHPSLAKLGISKTTCDALGIGYLENPKSPLHQCLVFQVRGLKEINAEFQPTILSHIGYKLGAEKGNRWRHYPNFHPESALYNLDTLFGKIEAAEQTQRTGHILLLDTPFDVAKCYEAGIFNAVSGSSTSIGKTHIENLQQIQKNLAPKQFLVWSHRQRSESSQQVAQQLSEQKLTSQTFDWEQSFPGKQAPVTIPPKIVMPRRMSVEQLQWLRQQKII